MTDKETKEELLVTTTTFVPGYKIKEIKGPIMLTLHCNYGDTFDRIRTIAREQYIGSSSTDIHAIIDTKIIMAEHTRYCLCKTIGTVVTLEKNDSAL
jgi:hypothetical protein